LVRGGPQAERDEGNQGRRRATLVQSALQRSESFV
jgi:hypothetical protein